VEYIALIFGPGTRLKQTPKEKPQYTVQPGPLSWMA
jgi:hypothetical protein